jgi:mannosyltransferase OCH1-like enzyme
MIPKVLHYCWFGGKKKPKLVRDCILSWKKYLPEYKIIEWNEKNSDLSHPFVKKAYHLKKWAFVSDYVRLNIIYEKGGIYLDTDMIVLKSFDSLLSSNCFLGAEDLIYINAAIIGAIPKNDFIKECLSLYDSLFITINSNLGEITIPRLITMKFNEISNNIALFDKILFHQDIVIYPAQYFYPFPFENKMDSRNNRKYIEPESFTVHLWNSSWIEYSEFYYFRNSEYLLGFKKSFKLLREGKKINMIYFRKIASAIRDSYLHN